MKSIRQISNSYLKSMRLQYDTTGGLPHFESLSGEPGERQRQMDVLWKMSNAIDRMALFSIFLEYALKKAKIETVDPVITHAGVKLSRLPSAELDYAVTGKVRSMWVELQYDPIQLLDVPREAAALGELALGFWESVLPRLATETDFPVEFVQEQIAQFRANEYAMSNALKPVKIIGSKAKACIHGKINCAESKLWVSVTYRGKSIFERPIWETPEQAFNMAYTKRQVVVEGGFLKVKEASMGLLPEASFPLDTLPTEFLGTLEEQA